MSSTAPTLRRSITSEPPRTLCQTWTSPLREFHLFPKLPGEIKVLVWKATLHSRLVELEFAQQRGFHTRVPLPVALHINRESRDAVLPLYPLCFGNTVHAPRTRFNFGLDTLFLSDVLRPRVPQLLVGLTSAELNQLEKLALSSNLIEPDIFGEYVDCDVIIDISKMVPSMVSLKKVQVVEYMWYGNSDGPCQNLELYNRYSDDFRQQCEAVYKWMCEGIDFTGIPKRYINLDCTEDVCECFLDPPIPPEFEIIEGVKLEGIWGWRRPKY